MSSNLRDRLRSARLNKNLLQTQVAKKTGINNKTLSGYERGVSEPDFETLKILADLYEVTTDYLIGKDDALTTQQIGVEDFLNLLDNLSDEQIIERFRHTYKNKELSESTIRQLLSFARFLTTQK